MRVLITCGPIWVPMDWVRVISNRSTGQMGHALAKAFLKRKARVTVVEGPLNAGHAEGGPYDVLLIDGAVEQLPLALVEQLRVGGRIATGLVERGVTRLAAGRRTANGHGVVPFADAECVLLPGFATPAGFRF